MNGTERLRGKRGHEHVTFAEVADHLEDFARRRPDARAMVNELARFLAGVEVVPHDHQVDGGTVDPSVPV